MDVRIVDEIEYARHEYAVDTLNGFLLGLVAAGAITVDERDTIINSDPALKSLVYPAFGLWVR